MKYRLGQRVRHRGLGITVRLLGRSEVDGTVLLDWDGSGGLRWWCPPGHVAANDNDLSNLNMYRVSALERMRGRRLASTLDAEQAELAKRAANDPQYDLQLKHLLAYAARRGMPLSGGHVELTAANDA